MKLITFTLSTLFLTFTINTNLDAQCEDFNSDFSSSAPKCTNQSVDFLNTGSSDPGYDYSWDFGADATPATSTDENPSGVIYSSSGLKTVVLTITDPVNGCMSTETQGITINQTPNASFASTAPACVGEEVDFTNTGSSGGDWVYSWDFGSGASPNTSSGENPSEIIYSNAGQKTITFTITDGSSNCSNTSTQTIDISEKPVAEFSSTAPACTDDDVDFTFTGTANPGDNFSWNFGTDATPATSNDENPTGIMYSSSGSKHVTLTVDNGVCTDTYSKWININQTPDVGFTSNAPVCSGSDVNFTNTGSTGGNWVYSWDFGSGASPATSSSENPESIVYSSGGQKTVTFTITDGSGNCSNTEVQTITIDQRPDADFSSTTPACTGAEVDFTFTGTTPGGSTFNWEFGSGATPATSALESPTGVTYATSGSKEVVLTVDDGTCTDVTTKWININQTPDISFTSNAPVCVDEEINFTNTGTTGDQWSYFWDFGSGGSPSTSNAENPEGITYQSGGQKTVTLTTTNGTCTATDSMNVMVNALPVADAGNDTIICANTCAEIGSAELANQTYMWWPSNTLDSSTSANPTACPIAPQNTYHVTVENTNTGCVNTDSVLVTMITSAMVDAGEDREICYGDSVQIGAALIEGQTYSWTPEAGLDDPTLPNPYATPEETTIYTVSASFQECDEITDEVKITVRPLPNADAGNDVTISRGESTNLLATGGVMYEWSPETGLNNPGIQDPVANPEDTTMYVVLVTNIYGCEETDTVTVNVITPDVWLPTAFTPNDDGRNDVLYVRGNGAVSFEFLVFNRWGELVFQTNNPDHGWDGRKQGTGEAMPTGAYPYRLKIELSDGEHVSKQGLVNLLR